MLAQASDTIRRMPLYEPFDPAPPRRLSPLAVTVRHACSSDIASIASLLQQRHGGELRAHADQVESAMQSRLETFCVAEIPSGIIGFGRCGRLEPPANRPANCVPAGWYLLGVIVDLAHRRRGVGTAITRYRLARLFSHARIVHYFTNENNRASIEFHRRFGFVEIARHVWAPGVTFTGGAGILFGLAATTNGNPSDLAGTR